MKSIHLAVLGLFINLVSCGDSHNSRLALEASGITENLKNCKSGCYGIPQEWYDLGIIVDNNGNKISLIDASIKKAGACNFKLCNDQDSSYNKDAVEWVERNGGKITYDDSDVIKCDNLKSTLQINQLSTFDIHENYINYEKETDC